MKVLVIPSIPELDNWLRINTLEEAREQNQTKINQLLQKKKLLEKDTTQFKEVVLKLNNLLNKDHDCCAKIKELK